MTQRVHAATRLLLLWFTTTVARGDGGLISAERSYDVTFPCERGHVCYDLWHFQASKTNDSIAVVCNGEIQKSKSQYDELKCTLQIKNLTEENHRCQKSPASTAATELILPPNETWSLQCVLLSFVEHGYCSPRVSLMWVDETGAQIHEHQMEQKSPCDVTLAVALGSLANKKFHCRATVDEQVQTSGEFWVRGPGSRQRGFIVEPKPEAQGHNQDRFGAAAGLVGCFVLTTLVAAFAVRRRRRSQSQTTEKLCNTISSSHDPEDVVYADVCLPACSDRVVVQECESTEYACVRYK